jgi:outer membrane protein OmpA-like peptidoglycan-associated protein
MLASVVAMFHDHPDWDRVRIEGHTDQRGDDAFNLALSERRAAAVQAALIAMGLSADRIEVVAFGESQPCDHGDTEEAHARNRRVELVMIDDPSGPAAPPEPIGETTLARAEGGSR